MRRVACAALCLMCAACAPAPDSNLFEKGEALYLKQDYKAAADLFKQRLIQDPDDAGAHFYLGTCYLYDSNKDWLGIAQGELETALALYERHGKVNPVPRFSADYFEMICHVNQAKIHLYLMTELLNNTKKTPGVNPRALIPVILRKCMEQASEAERIAPGDPDVEALKQLIQEFVGTLSPALRPRPAPVPAA